MWNSRPPPPLMAKTILNFHFDFLNLSLIQPVNCITSYITHIVIMNELNF